MIIRLNLSSTWKKKLTEISKWILSPRALPLHRASVMRLNCHVLWTWSDLYHLAANGRAAFIVISCPKHIYGMISRVVIIQGTERFTEIQQLMYQYSGWDALGFPSHRVRFTQLQCTSTCVHILSIVCQSVMLVNNLRSCCFDYLCHREKYVVGVGDSNAVVLQVMYMYREGKINKEWRQKVKYTYHSHLYSVFTWQCIFMTFSIKL